MNVVEIKHLEKRYPTFTLSDVSFDIPESQITGFIGKNGAGKTTTIKAMINLIHPDCGEIYYFGKSLVDFEQEIKNHIGYSTGSITWYPRKKIKDIVGILKRFYTTWDDVSFLKYRTMFDIDVNKSILQLSEGMKVKCNLLFALSHKPRVLILDEPTSGLDPFSRDELLNIFLQLKQEGVAIFFSTHIISDIEKCADNIVYISRGKIVASLPKDSFSSCFSKEGESLEDTMLRMERSQLNENNTHERI